jgi:tetratricopeptide (TPR) repeat protein
MKSQYRSAAWCGRPSHALPSAKMAAQGDDVPQLRGAFRTALASGGWASPDTLGHANRLAIALWEAGDHAEAEATLLDAQKKVNEDAFARTRRGRSALEGLAFALLYIDAAPEADALYGRVIALSTDAGDEVDSFWWSKWASVKAKLARWDEAISLRRKALDAAVRFDGAQSNAALVEYYFLADTLRQSGRADEALGVAEAGLKVADETQANMIRPLSKARILALQDLGDADALAEAVHDLRSAAATWSPELQRLVREWLSESELGPHSE